MQVSTKCYQILYCIFPQNRNKRKLWESKLTVQGLVAKALFTKCICRSSVLCSVLFFSGVDAVVGLLFTIHR